jgi:AraC-like DNA-binding protein
VLFVDCLCLPTRMRILRRVAPVSRRDSLVLQQLVARIQCAIGLVVEESGQLETQSWKNLIAQLQLTAASIPDELGPVAEKAVRDLLAGVVVDMEARLPDAWRLRTAAEAASAIRAACGLSLQEPFARYLDSLGARIPCANCERKIDRRCALALQLIRRTYTDTRLSLVDVAGWVQLSRWHFERLLHRDTGRSFTDHLHSVRMAAAVELMRDPCLSIKEIAVRVGYSSSTVFDRHFRKEFGLAPSSWRRRNC